MQAALAWEEEGGVPVAGATAQFCRATSIGMFGVLSLRARSIFSSSGVVGRGGGSWKEEGRHPSSTREVDIKPSEGFGHPEVFGSHLYGHCFVMFMAVWQHVLSAAVRARHSGDRDQYQDVRCTNTASA